MSQQLIRAGKKVLLIDADFSAPRLDKIFNLDDRPGLLEILEEKMQDNPYDKDIEQLAIISESVGQGKLFALKTGFEKKDAISPLGLIETPSFVELMAQYQKQVDYIVIITPPLLREVATYIINRATNTTMLILKERKSKIKDAVRATEIMNRVGISIMGLIVTESDYYNK